MIPTPKLTVPEKLDKRLRYLKYAVLAVFVVLLPAFLRELQIAELVRLHQPVLFEQTDGAADGGLRKAHVLAHVDRTDKAFFL